MQYFQPEPTFSNAGTCYTTNGNLFESTAFVTKNFRLMTNVTENTTLELNPTMHLFDASGRVGVRYALSLFPDLPATSIYWAPRAVMPDTIMSVALSLKQARKLRIEFADWVSTICKMLQFFYIQIDRNGLHGKKCSQARNASFASAFGGLPYSKRACLALVNQQYMTNCSMLPYFGIHEKSMDKCKLGCSPHAHSAFTFQRVCPPALL